MLTVIMTGAAVNLLMILLSTAGSILTARMLGPDGRGQFAAIQLWPSYLTTFGSLGLMNAAGYYCGREPRRAGVYFSTVWVVLMALALPVTAIGFVLIPFFLGRQGSSVIAASRLFLLIIPIQFIGNLPYFTLQGLGRFGIWNFLRCQFSVIWLLCLVAIWSLHRGTPELLTIVYLAAMSVQCMTWMFAMRRSVPGPYRVDSRLIPRLFSYGWPTVAASAPQQLNFRFDQMLMAVFLPPEALGFYVVAVAASGVSSPLLNAISQVILPKLSRQSNVPMQVATATRAMRLSFVVAVALALSLSAIIPTLLPLAFGNKFKASIPAAMVLVIAGCITGLNAIAAETVKGMGLPRLPLMAEMAGALCTIALLPLLLWKFGIVGAALTSLASYFGTYCIYIKLLSDRTGMQVNDCWLVRTDDIRFALDSFRVAITRSAGTTVESTVRE